MREARGEMVNRRDGESQPDEQGWKEGRGGGGEGLHAMGRDPSPYVWMSKRKLLMDLIMDDTVRTQEGGSSWMGEEGAVILNLEGAVIVLTPRVGKVAAQNN